MRKISYVLIILIIAIISNNSFSQCKPFAIGNKSKLADFIHDGAYTSIKIKPGQNLQLNKIFYDGQKYRLAITGESALGKLELKIFDQNKNVLYSNTEESVQKIWDFSVDATLSLTISVTVPVSDTNKNSTGCVSVLIGFKSTEALVEQYKNKKK